MKKVILLSVCVLLCSCTQQKYHIVREEVRSPYGISTSQAVGLPEYMLQTSSAIPQPVIPQTDNSSAVPVAYETLSIQQPTLTEAVYNQNMVWSQPISYEYQPDQIPAEVSSYQLPENTNDLTVSSSDTTETVIVSQPISDVSTDTEFIASDSLIPLSDPLMTVVLQHPQNRDLVKCGATDTTCLQQYEQQGYVRLRNAPRFAGFKELPTESDYPQGSQWRDSNNIPRW